MTNTCKTASEKVSKSFAGIGSIVKRLAVTLGSVFAVGKLISFGKEAVQLGSDLSEVQNVVDVTFGNLSEEINAFAKNAIEAYGLSETSAKRYASTVGAMFKSMGFAEGAAKDMSIEITKLAGDMASFYNLSSDEAFYKIRAGISGETEPLKQLGINLSVANLEQFALTQGIKKSYTAMNQQEQALLRYNYLLSVTADAQGDFSRTSDSWANQTRILAENFNALKATIGQGLINVLTPVIKAINALISRLQVAAQAFKSFTEMITGRKSEAASSGAANVTELADSYGEVTEATEEAEKAQKNYLSGLDEIKTFTTDEESAEANLPELGVGGELVQATENIDTSGAEEFETIFDRIREKIDGVIARVKELAGLFKAGFFDGLGDYQTPFENIKKSIAGVREAFANIFNAPEVQAAAAEFANSISYNLGRVVGAVGSIGTTVASTFIGGINSFLQENSGRIQQYITDMFNIGDGLANDFGKIAQDAAEIFSNTFGSETSQRLAANVIAIPTITFMGVTEAVGNVVLDIVNRITQTLDENKQRIEDAINGSLGAMLDVTESIKESVIYLTDTVLPDLEAGFSRLLDALGPVKDFIVDVFLTTWTEILNPAIQKVSGAVDQARQAFATLWENVLVPLGNLIMDILTPAFEIVSSLLGEIYHNILVPIADFVVDVFFAAWEAICALFENVLSPILSKVIEVLQFLWNNVGVPIVNWIKNNIMPVISKVTKNIGEAIGGIKNVFVGLLNFITSVFQGDWKKAWESVKKVFKGIWDTLVGIVKAPINLIIGLINGLVSGVVSGLNAVVRALNKISFDVPDWVPLIGGETFGFNLKELTAPKIPYLAQGAVIPPNAPFAAVLGDQRRGTNIEAPLDTIKEAVRAVLDEHGVSSGAANYTFIAQINRRTLFEEMMSEAQMRRTQSGRNPFELA